MNTGTPSKSLSASAQGILMVVIALSIAAFSGAIMKVLGNQISAYQIAWFRFTGMSVILLPYLVRRYGLAGLKPARPLIQMVRGLTMAGGTTAFVIGVQTVDYADAIAILYAYPFLLVIIAVVFLGEHADASTLAPFTYSEIVSAILFGYLFFGSLPSLLSWVGILLITAGGIYVARVLRVKNISRRVPKF